MPCTTYESPQEIQEQREAHERALIARAQAEMRDPLLCSACRALERLGYDFDENPALSKWWDGHKKEDARKAAEERAAEVAEEFAQNRIKALAAKKFGDLTEVDKKFLQGRGLL